MKKSQQLYGGNQVQCVRLFGMSTLCKGHVLVVQRGKALFLELKVVPEWESWASGSINRQTAFQWALIGTTQTRWQS